MKTRKILTILVLGLGLLVWPVEVSEAGPMGTAFTYQGRLMDANEAADGVYDFQFKLFDAPSGPNQVGGDVNKPDVNAIDGYFTVELDFGSGVFDGNERWLEIGVRPGELEDPNVYTPLTPRQEVTPTPYALHTPWLLVDTHLSNVYLGKHAGGNNTTGSFNSAMGFGALRLNTTGHYNSAVGVSALLHNTTGNFNSALGYEALYYNDTGHSNAAMGNYALRSNAAGNYNSAMGHQAGYSNITGSGNVFLGYQAGYYETGNNKLYIENSDSSTPLVYGEFDNDLVKINGNLHIYTDSNTVVANNTGNQTVGVLGYRSATITAGAYGKNNQDYYGTLGAWHPEVGHCGVFGHAGGGNSFAALGAAGWAGHFQGNVTIRDTDGNETIRLNGTTGWTRTKILEITGGSDLSEQFDIGPQNGRPEPGMVVSIDRQNPGKLVLSSRPYERTVAGIVSGAGGVNTGMLMGHQGSQADGANPVALTGRVYCWADASNSPIEPGDLLTTAEKPGHAMKATDHIKAQGAIIGKAMTGLPQGRGLVLVLVSLQ